jgi:hypothetical protein
MAGPIGLAISMTKPKSMSPRASQFDVIARHIRRS